MNELGLGMVFSAKDLASGVITKVSKGMLDLEGRSSGVGKAIEKNFQSFSTGLATFGAGASMLGGAFALAEVSGKFNEQVASVGAVANASAEELAALHDAAIDAGVATQFSPTEAVVGLGDLAQAGYNAQESISLLRPVLDLAAGSLGQLSPSGAAGLASQTMKAFKIPIDQAGITMDKLLQSVNAFALSANELPLALGTAARGAGVMNQSLDETLIALGLVKNVVPGVERASTAVAVAMERMVNPETAAALKAQGVAVADIKGKFRPFLDVVQDLIPALNKMGTEQKKAAFLSKTFGTEALGGIQAILGQVTNGIRDNTGATVKGAEAITYLRNTFKDAGGTAAEFASKMLDTFEGQKKLFRGSMETLAIVLGEPFERALKPVVSAVLGLLNQVLAFVKNMPQGMKDFIAKLVLGVGAVLSLVGGLIAAKAAIAMFLYGMSAVGITVGGVVSTLAPALVLLAALVGIAYAFKYAFDRNLGGIADRFTLLYERISLFKDALVQLFTDGGFSGAVLEAFGDSSTEPIVNAAIRIYVVFNRLEEFFSAFVDGILEGFDGMGPTITRVVAAFESLGVALGFLTEDIDVGANADALDRWGQVGFKAGELVAGAIDWVINAVASGMEFVGGFADNWDEVSAAGSEFVPIFQDVGDMIMGVLLDLGLLDSGTGSSTSNWRAFGHAVATIVGGVLSVVRFVFRAVVDQFSGVVTYLSGAVDVIAGLMTGDFSRVWRGVKKEISGILQVVLATFGPMVEIVATAIDKLASLVGVDLGLGEKVHGMRSAMKDTLKDWAEFGNGTKTLTKVGADQVAPGVRTKGETMPQDLIDFYAMPTPGEMGYSPAANPAAAVQQATQSGFAPTNDNVAAAIAEMKAVKQTPATFTAVLSVDGQVLGEVVAKQQASANAGNGGVTPVQVQ